MFGCGEEFLEEAQVYRDLDATTAYQSQDDAVLAVSAAYTPLQYQGLYRRYRYLLDYMSGDLDITSGGFQLTEYPGFNFNPASQHLIPAAWSACFIGIMRANVALDRVPDVQFLDEDLRTRVLAEARFLRGFYYFELVRLYGGVPIFDRPFSGDLSDPLFQPARNTEEEVYAFIEADLQAAAEDLPLAYEGLDIGRATAGAAQAYLGMAHLYQQEYQQARDAFLPIINGELGEYALVPFIENFTAENENNAESVFEVQFTTGVGRGFSDLDRDDTAESFWIATALNPGRARAFANGVPSVEVNNFFDQFPEEDSVRRLYTIARPGDTWGSWDPIYRAAIDSGQFRDRTGEREGVPLSGVRKYTEGPDPVGFVQSPRNFRALRYVDVLLMFAEAENEVNGPTAEAYDAVNQVRMRAAAGPLPAGLSQAEFF